MHGDRIKMIYVVYVKGLLPKVCKVQQLKREFVRRNFQFSESLSPSAVDRPPFGRTAFESNSTWPPYLGFKVHRREVRWLFLTWKREIFPQGLDVVTIKNTALTITKKYLCFSCTCGEHRPIFPHGPSNFALRTVRLVSWPLSWYSDNSGSRLITGLHRFLCTPPPFVSKFWITVFPSIYVRVQSDIFDKWFRLLCLVRQRKRVCFCWLTNC
jgi:hypothetical protein